MRLQIYRLASADQSLARVARYMRDLYRGGNVRAEQLRPCVAYESAELAAMSSPELLWSVRRKTEVLRETITLPIDGAAHLRAPASLHIDSYDGDSTPTEPIQDFLLRANLLTVWIPSSLAPAQHAVFINPCHSAFDRIGVVKRQLLLTRPSWSGKMHLPDPLATPAAVRPSLTEPMLEEGIVPHVTESLPAYILNGAHGWIRNEDISLRELNA